MADAVEPDYIDETIAIIHAASEAREGPGRPLSLTSTKLRRLFAALERGNFREHACAYARIPYSTFRDWISAGEDDETHSTPQWGFYQAVQLAEALWTDAMVGRVNTAAEAHPRFYMAAIIALSRRQRNHWAEQTHAPSQNEVSVAIGIQVQVQQQTALPAVEVSARQLPAGETE